MPRHEHDEPLPGFQEKRAVRQSVRPFAFKHPNIKRLRLIARGAFAGFARQRPLARERGILPENAGTPYARVAAQSSESDRPFAVSCFENDGASDSSDYETHEAPDCHQ